MANAIVIAYANETAVRPHIWIPLLKLGLRDLIVEHCIAVVARLSLVELRTASWHPRLEIH